MKHSFLRGLSALFMLSFFGCATAEAKRHFVIVVASYNNAQWYRFNLDSLIDQETNEEFDYHIVYTDDCSQDGTAQLVEAYIAEKQCADKITLIKNTTRKFALENMYNAIHLPWIQDDYIIALVDGDDRLADNKVFLTLNDIYKNPNVWLTYGSYTDYPSGNIGQHSYRIPNTVIEKNDFRKYHLFTSHLKTFYAKLFRSIKRENLCFKGAFASTCSDRFFMYPLCEMAAKHIYHVPRMLYTYNAASNLNDYKVVPALQAAMLQYCRNLQKYKPLKKLF